MVRWQDDAFGDWIQAPALTWGRKRGDCEDLAALAIALLGQIGIDGYLLSVILDPVIKSHAVCVFQDSEGFFNGCKFSRRVVYKVFSNQTLDDRNYDDILDIIEAAARGFSGSLLGAGRPSRKNHQNQTLSSE